MLTHQDNTYIVTVVVGEHSGIDEQKLLVVRSHCERAVEQLGAVPRVQRGKLYHGAHGVLAFLPFAWLMSFFPFYVLIATYSLTN